MNIDFSFIIYYLHEYYGKYESQHLLSLQILLHDIHTHIHICHICD